MQKFPARLSEMKMDLKFDISAVSSQQQTNQQTCDSKFDLALLCFFFLPEPGVFSGRNKLNCENLLNVVIY